MKKKPSLAWPLSKMALTPMCPFGLWGSFLLPHLGCPSLSGLYVSSALAAQASGYLCLFVVLCVDAAGGKVVLGPGSPSRTEKAMLGFLGKDFRFGGAWGYLAYIGESRRVRSRAS